MTAPTSSVQFVGKDVQATVRRMKDDHAERDQAMQRVRLIRDGKFAEVWPDHFSERYPTALVANFVDQAARDLAANLSPLPSLSCASGNMRTDADKRRAEKKNRIGFNYWRHSRLEFRMKSGADQYITYGFLPFYAEADYEAKLPKIRVEDPEGSYFDLNRDLECVHYAHCWEESVGKLAAQYPEVAYQLRFDKKGVEYQVTNIEVVRYCDDTSVILYCPSRGGLILAQYEHGFGFTPVHIALRPGLHLNPRGQFDDVLWVQLAHAVMTALTMEAGHKAVEAPLAVPSDVNEINIGPDALLVTDSPEKINRVPLNVPNAPFMLTQNLKEEMKEGAGYPETRLGNVSSSAITGRGISALEGGFDTQIQLGQDVLKLALITVTGMCFAIDEKLWPNKAKTINGTLSGESFEVTYTPARDINGNYACDVSYGFATGTSPNGAIVTLLQLRGDKIIGRDTFRRQLPFDVDVDQQQREVDEEDVNSALMQGLSAAIQASGQMIAQGQTQEAITFFQAAASVIKGRREGKDLADLILEVFTQQQQQQQAQAQAQMAQMQQQAQAAGQGGPGGPGGPPGAPGGAPGGGGEALDGVMPNGLPMGVAPGQAGMAPGGRPSVTDLTAGFSANGNPSEGATVHRRIPTG